MRLGNRWLLLGLVVLLVSIPLCAGCEGEGDVDGTATTLVNTSTSTSVAPPPTDAFDEEGYGATTVVTGLHIPWEMRFLPDGRLLVTERRGRLLIADVGTGEVTEVGRIKVLPWGEGGLMGLALDPDFPATPKIYVSYTTGEVNDAHNRVSSFMLAGLEGGAVTLGTETVLLDDVPAWRVHDGSRVAFGPDGYLWVTFGDAGDGALAQRMDSLAGKVLRMTSEGQPAPGNPFADQPYPFSLIYTLGHRNPQGLDFHPESGKAYITEHGPSEDDEVNVLQPGGNYGWPDVGGKAGREGFVDALAAWTPTLAVAGAVFCTDDAPAGLEGTLVFVTLKESDVRVLHPTDELFTEVASETVLFDAEFGRLRAVALGPDGSLYIATSNHDGRIEPGAEDDRIIRIQKGD